MKTATVCLSILAALLLAGCGPADSLNPLFHEKDVIFDPDLVGVWAAGSGEARFEKSGASDNEYQILSLDTAGQCDPLHDDVYEAHLVNLGGHHFLDVTQRKSSVSMVTNQFHVVRNKAGYGLEPNLFYLDNDLFADFALSNSEKNGATYELRFRPAHYFFTVQSDGKKLQLGMLDEDWLEKAIQKGKVKIAHAEVGEGHKLVLTAATEELQSFVLEYEKDKDAFPPMDELRRK